MAGRDRGVEGDAVARKTSKKGLALRTITSGLHEAQHWGHVNLDLQSTCKIGRYTLYGGGSSIIFGMLEVQVMGHVVSITGIS